MDSKFRIDTIGIEVDYPVVEGFYAVPRDADVVMLVGFCGGDFQHCEVIPVRSLAQTLTQIGAVDSTGKATSPLARSLMAAWNAGARYIVLIKAGDSSELDGLGDEARATLLYDRLAAAYDVATGLEWSGIVVPTDVTLEGGRVAFSDVALVQQPASTVYGFPVAVGVTGLPRDSFTPHPTTVYVDGAPLAADAWEYNPILRAVVLDTLTEGAVTADGFWCVDYARQLAAACAASVNEGSFVQGIIASAERTYPGVIGSDPCVDRHAPQVYTFNRTGRWVPRLDEYRFLSAVAGHGHFYLEKFGCAFEHDLAATTAGLMSSLPYDVSAAGRIVPNVRLSYTFTDDEADKLSFLGVITYGEPVEARRWNMPRVVCRTDQNMATQVSDFQQNVTMRLVRRVTYRVRSFLEEIIGSDGSGVEGVIAEAMATFIQSDLLKSYDFKVARDPDDPYRLQVLLTLDPYFTTKRITIGIKAGPFNA